MSETPARLGFGQAALNLTRFFRMDAKLLGADPKIRSIQLPIRFTLPPGPSLETALGCYDDSARTLERTADDPQQQVRTGFWIFRVAGMSFARGLRPSAIERNLTNAREGAAATEAERKACDAWYASFQEQSRTAR